MVGSTLWALESEGQQRRAVSGHARHCGFCAVVS
jgi:hypothetical protein